MELEIQSRHGSLDAAWHRLIVRLAARIGTRYPDTLRIHVVVEHLPHHRHGAERVSLLVHSEARELRAEKSGAHVHDAIRAAFAAMEGALARHHVRHRNSVKNDLGRRLGSIKRIFRDGGFGFIHDRPGHDVYFKREALHGLVFESLAPGDPVEFEFEQGQDGPQASQVHPPGAHRHR
jgi:cold shock CspA family protein/ribosome-associated translation inhibitor RaiA